MKLRSFSILFITMILFTGIVGAESFPPPGKVFGFHMGADRKLIDWNQISDYFFALDKGSDRIIVKELGKTTLGKPFLLAIISSADNIKNIDRYQAIQQQLANPYDLHEEKAQSLVKQGKVVVLVSLNIHSTEIASSQESVELAYEMVTRTDPGIKKILDNVILLLIPSLNPDGQQMVVDWYRKHVGTPNEGCDMPWLYHHYAGHDNNRDWYMFNLKESQLTAPVLYHQWFPEIVYDQHQMGSTGPRLFMPPYSDPVNRNTHTTVMAETNMLGKHVVADLHEQGFKGIITGMRFNAFFEGTMSKTPLWHNMVGILSEMASVRIATPVYLPRGSLGRYGAEIPKYSRVTDFLDPWEGGWWRLRDIIEYEKAVTYSILDLAATYKKKFMMNFYSMNKESIERGKKEPPYAFIVPLTQHDPNSASEMLKRLQINGARIYRAQSQFVYASQTYPAGTYIVPLSQPSRPCIKDLLEPQNYPDLEQYPGGPPQPPYDVTGWTINIQMGVDVVEMKTPPRVGLSLTETFDFGPSGMIDTPAKAYLVERRYNNAFAVFNQLLKDNADVYWSDMELSIDGKTYPAGTFIIPAQKGIDKKLESLANDFKVPVYGIHQPVPVKGTKAMLPRLGLYHSWTASMDEGWTRLVLDNYRYSYKKLYNEEIKKGKLTEKFDVIIIPDLSIESIVEGKGRRWEHSEPVLGDAQKPEKYQGGIGKKGIEALTDFVKAGGTLIAFGEAADFTIEKLKVPAVNVLKGLDEKEFYAPGSLLQIELDTAQPLAYGMPKKTAIRMTKSPAFILRLHIQESRAIGYYSEDNPLLSGWLKGPEKLAGRTALAEILIEKGRVILFGFRVQSRAQTFGTFKLLFNAIHTSRIQSVKTLEFKN
jgi:hypothetical protein